MNHTFVPNFPPPPIPTGFNFIQCNTSAIDAPSELRNPNLYKHRLQKYLKNQKISSELNQSQKSVKLNEVTKEVSHGFDMIEMIKNEIERMSQNSSSISESEWNQQIAQLNCLTDDLSAICSKYNDSNLLDEVQNLVEKRHIKRDRIKKRKAETKMFRKFEAINRERKHHEIDKWLKKNTEEILKNQREIETKQRAEQILMDVKTRKTEAEKSILDLNSLKELNRVRNRNKNVTDDTEFNREIDEIKEIWVDAHKKYEIEEKGLRTFLNCTNILEEWRNVMFGEPKKEYATFSAKKKDSGFNQLIKIRNLWDKCIVPENNPFGSNIPIGWVFPNPNPTDQWKKYIKEN